MLIRFLLILTLLAANALAGQNQFTPSSVATSGALASPLLQNAVPFVNKTLPNGLEVIVLPDSSIPLVTVEIAVRNGSFTETEELNGLSHLYEHMFFKPNEAQLIYRCELALRNNRRDYFEGANCQDQLRLKSVIGNLLYLNDSDQLTISNASTREEVVNYYVNTTSPYLESALRLMNHSIRYPNFDPQQLSDEIKVVIGEVDRNESNPFYFLNRELTDRLFYKYPTRKNPLGTRETILSATVEKMRMIQSRYYVPNNAAVVVTGDVRPTEVFKLTEKIFGDWEPREKDPFREFPLVDHPPLEKSEGAFVVQPVRSVLIQAGWHGPSIGVDDEATYAADVFSYILMQPNSRFQRAMVDSGLTAGTNVGYYTQRNVGPIQFVLVTAPDRAKAALKTIYSEIEEWDDPEYYSDEELEAAKTILEAQDLFEREKLTDYSHVLGFWWSSTGIDYFRSYHDKLRAVSREDINRYVRTYIKGKPHVAVAMLSAESKAASGLTENDLTGESDK